MIIKTTFKKAVIEAVMNGCRIQELLTCQVRMSQDYVCIKDLVKKNKAALKLIEDHINSIGGAR